MKVVSEDFLQGVTLVVTGILTAEERRFVTAAVDRLIPADDTPSASEIGAVDYIDAQLAGAYGRGDIYYLQPPFQQGLATQGYQAEAPALLFKP